MKPGLFTLEPGRYYAWHMFPGYSQAPYCSPIRVNAITPLKRGDGSFELEFVNCFYAEGLQDMTYRLRTIRRTPEYLVAEVENSDRTVVISALSDEWSMAFGRGYFEPTLMQHLEQDTAPLSLHAIGRGSLYLGEFPHEGHIPYLQSLGIDAVLSIVDDRDPHRVCERVRTSFEWAQIPVRDSLFKGIPTVDDLADAVAVMREWRTRGIQRIYVHCVAGQGRSPLVTMAYLVMGKEGHAPMRLTKAIAKVSNGRPQADPNVHQLRVLADYVDKALHEPRYHPDHYKPSNRVVRHRPEANLELTVPAADAPLSEVKMAALGYRKLETHLGEAFWCKGDMDEGTHLVCSAGSFTVSPEQWRKVWGPFPDGQGIPLGAPPDAPVPGSVGAQVIATLGVNLAAYLLPVFNEEEIAAVQVHAGRTEAWFRL